MALHHDPNTGSEELQFVAEDFTLLTSARRARTLSTRGYHFEAAMTWGTMVEASLLLVLASFSPVERTRYDEKAIQQICRHNLSLHGAINLATRATVIAPNLGRRLQSFRKKRNRLVHHACTELGASSALELVQEGDALAHLLWRELRLRVQGVLKPVKQ